MAETTFNAKNKVATSLNASETGYRTISSKKVVNFRRRDCFNFSWQYKIITPERVLCYRDIFESFFIKGDKERITQLNNIGFNLDEVLAKKEKILTFLKAYNVLKEYD